MSIEYLTIYKETIISKLTQSQNIKDLILSSNGVNNLPDNELLYNYIFPYLYNPEIQSEIKTGICLDSVVSKIINSTVNEIKIIINVFSHKDGMKHSDTDISKTNPDIISEKIHDMLSYSREFGIGKLSLESVDLFNLQNTYYGKTLNYKCAEFNNRKI